MTQPDPLQEALNAQRSGDFRTAEDGYRRVLQRNPRNDRAWGLLGALCFEQGRLTEALGCHRQQAELNPRDPQAHQLCGNTLVRLANYPEAEAAYRRALELQPGCVEALVNLGFALGELERLDEARECYERARGIAPAVPEIHHNLGNILREKSLFEEALSSYNEAIRLRPDYAKAFINKGIALISRGRLTEATACAKKAVELLPNFAEAHNTLAHALSVGGDIAGAAAAFDRAIELKPDYADAHWNRSLLELIRGDYERGWQGYEWRWQCKRATPLPPFVKPRWDGSDLSGRTLLLHAEQGLGDVLHFVRYAPLIQARGGRVIVQCQGGLMPLLSRTPGIDQLAAWGKPSPPHDVWLPMMSAPTIFKTTLDTIPADIPYLFPDPALVERWRRELAAVPGLRIGIAWQGSPRHPWDRHRSAPLAAFEPLAKIPGVQLISLQKGDEQPSDQSAQFPLIPLSEFTDRIGAFVDTAAILKNLDLVIAVDTAVVHLAGGLGVPVWVALHRTPDWRWLLDRPDTPWYPSMRLFRQKTFGEWGPVFDEIARELKNYAESRQRSPELFVEVSAGELLDKLSILRLKSERIQDPEKLRNVHRELETLGKVREGLKPSAALEELERELFAVNASLWEIEDAIREHELRQDFSAAFVELARSVYRTNDRRAELKRRINELLQSRLVEEKSYAEYGKS
jgi:tetratricopeptide (TPR) repeat protein